MQLCGEDCQIRWEVANYLLGSQFNARHQALLLKSFEQQADYNLRHSFAVVGMLEKTDEFYDMVSRRVQYMDMSRNSHVMGGRHESGATASCREVYRQEKFRRKMKEKSPAVAAMVRLYQTALKVNVFHRKELDSCPLSNQEITETVE